MWSSWRTKWHWNHFSPYTTNTPYSFTQHQGYTILATMSLNTIRNRPPTFTSISQLVSSIQISWIKLCMHISSSHVRPILPFFSSLPQWRYSHGFCGLLAPGYCDLRLETHEEKENMYEFFSPLRLCSQRPCDGLIPYPTSHTSSL
jgi:hypothetical protein